MASAILHGTNDPANTVYLYIGSCAQNFSGHGDAEFDGRPDLDVGVHAKQHASGGDVAGFSFVSGRVGLNLNGKVQRETDRAAHFLDLWCASQNSWSLR